MSREINVYFDTNVLLNKNCDTRIFEFNNFFKDCVTFAKLFNAYSSENESRNLPSIKLIVPEIVVDEVKQKIIENRIEIYERIKTTTQELVDNLEKIHYYSLAFINQKGERISEPPNIGKSGIKLEVNSQLQSFLENNDDFEVLNYSFKEEIFDELLEKVVSRMPPFTSAKKNKKTYTDAGFKDAILVCSILRTISSEVTNYILSNDNDIDSSLHGTGLIDVIKPGSKNADRVFEDIFDNLGIDLNWFKAEVFLMDEYTKSVLCDVGIEVQKILSVELDEENSNQVIVYCDAMTIDGALDKIYQIIVDLNGRVIVETQEISYEEVSNNEAS